MTDEQLIFAAGDATERARLLCGALWKELPDGTASASGTLDRERCADLRNAAGELNCAATELFRRSQKSHPLAPEQVAEIGRH